MIPYESLLEFDRTLGNHSVSILTSQLHIATKSGFKEGLNESESDNLTSRKYDDMFFGSLTSPFIKLLVLDSVATPNL